MSNQFFPKCWAFLYLQSLSLNFPHPLVFACFHLDYHLPVLFKHPLQQDGEKVQSIPVEPGLQSSHILPSSFIKVLNGAFWINSIALAKSVG